MKQKISRLILSVITFIFVINLIYASNDTLKEIPKAVNGVLDLSDWDFEKDGIIQLGGEWEFYWERLLEPSDFLSDISSENGFVNAIPLEENIIPKTGYMILPNNWSKYEINGEKLGRKGYATFRLVMRINDTNITYGLKIPDMARSHLIWLNGRVISSNGIVGRSNEETIHQTIRQMKFFKTETKTIEIIMQIANFTPLIGGPWQPIYFGATDQIHLLRDRQFTLDILLAGALLIIGIYHLTLFIIRRKDFSLLYFALICILIAFRTAIVNERFLIYFYPQENWEFYKKIETMIWYFSLGLFAFFLRAIFPKTIQKKHADIAFIISLAVTLFVLFTPSKIFLYSAPIMLYVTIIYSILGLYSLVISLIKKQAGSLLILIGFFIFFLTVVNDFLYIHDGINSFGEISSIGFLIFILFQSFVIAIKFSKAFEMSENVSKELDVKVKIRTEELQNVNDELKLLAATDYLTGLYNIQELKKKVINEENRVKRYRKNELINFAVIFIDLDNFQYYNDNFGYSVGDKLMVEFSKILKKSTRTVDFISRFGGDEFVILMPETNGNGAAIFGNRILSELKDANYLQTALKDIIKQPVDISKQFILSCSMGISEYLQSNDLDINKLINEAHKALIYAKRFGKNRYILWKDVLF